MTQSERHEDSLKHILQQNIENSAARSLGSIQLYRTIISSLESICCMANRFNESLINFENKLQKVIQRVNRIDKKVENITIKLQNNSLSQEVINQPKKNREKQQTQAKLQAGIPKLEQAEKNKMKDKQVQLRDKETSAHQVLHKKIQIVKQINYWPSSQSQVSTQQSFNLKGMLTKPNNKEQAETSRIPLKQLLNKIVSQCQIDKIIETFKQKKQYFKQGIELFKYFKQENQRHFHSLFDHRKNILLLIKLQNQKTIACFTELQFRKRFIPEQNSCAFIMDVTRNEVYQAKNPMKTIVYDESYIIWGNSEIRIKYKDNHVYSNFGITKQFFDSRNHGVEKLLGIKQSRLAQIKQYAIFQLFE